MKTPALSKQEVIDRFVSCGHVSYETGLPFQSLRYHVSDGTICCLKGSAYGASALNTGAFYPLTPDKLAGILGGQEIADFLYPFLFSLNPVVVNREKDALVNCKEVRNYPITVSWSEEDQLFLARTPAFPFIMAHGNTPQEAAKEMTEALTGAIETLNEKGICLPDESTIEPTEETKALRRLHTEVGKLYKPSVELSNAWSNAGYVLSKGDKNHPRHPGKWATLLPQPKKD